MKIGGLFGGPLLGVFLLGAFSPRCNAQGALAGGTVGLGAVLGISWFTSISFMWYAPFATVVACAVGWVCSRAFPPPRPDQIALTHAGRPGSPLR